MFLSPWNQDHYDFSPYSAVNSLLVTFSLNEISPTVLLFGIKEAGELYILKQVPELWQREKNLPRNF